MTITSSGYTKTITTAAAWGEVATHGVEYSVRGTGDFAVSQVAADRTVRVAPGKAWGKGIRDVSDAQETRVLNPIASGARWDTVVVRRDRSKLSDRTTIEVLVGNTSEAIAQSRKTFETGEVDDQPIALVQVSALDNSQGVVTAVRDLRCWGANAGLIAKSPIVMGYLDQPGTKVRIGAVEWSLEFNPDGTLAWTRTDGGRFNLGLLFEGVDPNNGSYGTLIRTWIEGSIVLPTPRRVTFQITMKVKPVAGSASAENPEELQMVVRPVANGVAFSEDYSPIWNSLDNNWYSVNFTFSRNLPAGTHTVGAQYGRIGGDAIPYGVFDGGLRKGTALSVYDAGA